jgi:CDP-paratose 2-epimerase
VLDNRRAAELWQWKPTRSAEAILDEIARFAENHPDWLDISRA